MSPFIGRKTELSILEDQLKKRVASLVVVRGRRRIGKSRLIEEFSKAYQSYIFTGIPPTKETTKQSQINEFARQLKLLFSIPNIHFEDWGDLFWYLADKLPKKRVILVFDEISWMGSKDPDFLGKLKMAWDLYFKKNNELMLILCGSVSAWIEKNIIAGTGFVGRISCTLTLGELSLSESNEFFRANQHLSNYEKFKLLAVTGGIPRYLEEMRIELSAEQNIKKTCFSSQGFLFNEFNQVFHDIFLSRSTNYYKTMLSLIEQNQDPLRLSRYIEADLNSVISNQFNELVLAGFLARDYTWDLKSQKISKLSTYRLKDNYCRFYLKYIAPHRHQIEAGSFEKKSLTSLPGWSTIMGFQFENLILNNRLKIWAHLEISPDEIVFDNPFFQNKTSKQNGCQIDYLIQTKFCNLYVCEIKFSSTEIKHTVINEVQDKISNLKKPRGFSCRPILIHVNGITDKVRDSGFFSHIIDFGQLLQIS
ncbi:MAG: ATP-binding protein [Gammaproteobacteria bacterium]